MMGKARMYGMKSICVPNREADMRRRNNAFWNCHKFAEADSKRAGRKNRRRSGDCVNV